MKDKLYIASNRHAKDVSVLFEICTKANPNFTQEEFEKLLEVVFGMPKKRKTK